MNRSLELQQALHQTMYERAEEKLNFSDMLSSPTVVLDLTASEFWTMAMNSSRKNEALAHIADGTLIPFNADALTDITTVHSIWHAYLHESGIQGIPTFVNLSRSESHGEVILLSNHDYTVPVIPNLYVHKRSADDQGVDMSHGGAGVSFVKAVGNEVRQYLPRHIGEYLQPFVMPRIEEDGSAFVRDVRTYIVGGKPVAGMVCRAKESLSLGNLNGDSVPRMSQVHSANVSGPREELTGHLRDVVFDQAGAIADALDKIISARNRPFSPYSTIGFMSIDFLIDGNGTPLPGDCDIQPVVSKFHHIDKTVGTALGQYAADLTQATESEKQVVIIGFPDEPYVIAAYEKACSLLGEDRVVFQESLMSHALRTLKGRF